MVLFQQIKQLPYFLEPIGTSLQRMLTLSKSIAIILSASALNNASAFATKSTAFTRSIATTSARKIATTSLNMSDAERYSIPDQPARFARAKKENNERYLNIESVYDGSYLKGKRVAITGANRGIGLALAKELVANGGKLVAIVRSSSPELEALNPEEIVTGIDVTSDEDCEGLSAKVKGGPIDILVNNAGYFYDPVESVVDNSLNFKEELKVGTFVTKYSYYIVLKNTSDLIILLFVDDLDD